jgi:hypothetical protein
MNYNFSDIPLKLREYGRNIQSMIEYAKSIEDKEVRTVVAHEIIRIMGNLNPSIKDNPDFKQKLWESLFQISGYDLDVEAPYPVPEKNTSQSPVKESIGYNNVRPRYRQYGANIQLMIQKAAEVEDEETRKAYINSIANTMQLFNTSSHRDTALEQTLANHINEMAKGKLNVMVGDFTLNKLPANHSTNNQRGSRKHNGKSNNKSKRNTNKGLKRRRK